MTEPGAPRSKTIPHPSLEAEDARLARVEANRRRLHERLDAAFERFTPAPEEVETAELVRRFLAFVADNIHAYATRTRVQHPETGAVVEAEWVTLCGATIAALDVPERIRSLVLELVDGVVPEDDRPRREALWRAAGVPFRERASAADVSALQREGMLAAFAGKLLADCKRLVATAETQDAAAYFDTAARVARELQESPYQTNRDRRFLRLLRKQYQGGLLALVDAQRQATLAEMAERDRASPGLERVLRTLLERSYEPVQNRSLEDWAIANRVTYQSETYVYARIDEFRESLQRRISELEAQPMLNPEATLEAVTPEVEAAVARLAERLAAHGVSISPQPRDRIDVMQVARENASVLARPELAADLDAWLGDEALLGAFARYKVAAFRCAQPTLKTRIEHDLVLWDELLRSAPLTEAQQRRLADLREDLLGPLRDRGVAIPEDLPEPRMLLPFGRQVLPLLTGEEDYGRMERFIRRVRRVYEDPAEGASERPSSGPWQAMAPGAQTERPETAAWVPTLLDVPEGSGDESEGAAAEPTGPRARSSTAKTWIRVWGKPRRPAPEPE